MKKYFVCLVVIPALLLSAGKKATSFTFTAKELEKRFAFIPQQWLDTVQVFADSYCPDSSCFVKIPAFYMCELEISNGFYVSYLNELKTIYRDTAAYRKALPDTLVWREKTTYNEPYVDYYLRHPVYSNYPVVGVTHEQALGFCTWLTKKYKTMPGHKYANATFDLPAKAEWWAAAGGGHSLNRYSWDGIYLRNSHGAMLANFRAIDEGSIVRDTAGGTTTYVAYPGGELPGIAGRLNDYADVLAPVDSYYPNAYGLHNMNGNVEELVKEKGISKGGSWRDTGYYLRNAVEEHHEINSTSAERGFRIVMRVN